MTEAHTVERGDTLYGIARSNGIRYWPNLYLATVNVDFMHKRPNPSLIYPGDVVHIPPEEAIAPMEARPILTHRNFPLLYSQSTPRHCWRACGLMLYAKKNGLRDRAPALARFTEALGPTWAAHDEGLQWSNSREVYVDKLGLRQHTVASINEINRAVAEHGPVIVAFSDSESGHAMIIAGYNIFPGNWTVIDPLGGSVTHYNFEVDGSSSTDFTPGEATWEGLARTMGFFENGNIDPRIYSV